MRRLLSLLFLLGFGWAWAGHAQPVIVTQPQARTNLSGTAVSFSVIATGAPPLSYQWILNSTSNRLPGATNDTLTIVNVQTNHAGNYRVNVSDSAGSVQSGSARLTVVAPPTIAPANPTASLFADVTLRATNSSSISPTAYQWFFNGEPVEGAATNRLALTNVRKTHAGNYAVVFTYAFGSATSQVASLTITPFHSIYFFGDSWTDTGGNGCTWAAPDYYRNRACNGPMWPEFLAAGLGLTYGDSAQNVAHCGDTTADILPQVANRILPGTSPQLSLYASLLPGLDLFVMYPGGYRGVYVDPTNQSAITQIINVAVRNVSNTVQTLYAKGARAILYMNQGGTNAPDIPVLGMDRAILFDAHVRRYNAQFSAAMDAIRLQHADVRIYEADFYKLWDDVSTQPAPFGFTDILTPGLSEANRAFDGPGANHLYWDGTAGHATSKFHALMAAKNLEALRTNAFERMSITASSDVATIAMSHLLIGRDYALQSSRNLQDWLEVENFTASTGTNRVTVPWNGGATAAFFRLRWIDGSTFP